MAKKKELLPGEAKIKNEKQELFCIIYAGVASGYYFGNATRCYMHAYGFEERMAELDEEIDETFESGDVDTKNERRRLKSEKKSIERTCQANGARLLSNAIVSRRVAFLLDRYLSDDYADREMAYVIGQRDDLMSKVAAYREVAKVKERIRGAGALSGEFTFKWEGDDDAGGGKKKPRLASAKLKSTADEPDRIADFAA